MGLKFIEPGMPQILELSLELISKNYSLRCDAKQALDRFIKFDEYIERIPHFELGEYFPKPLIKGIQPNYIEEIGAVGIPVINTLSIQNLKINKDDCRLITEEDFEHLDSERKCKTNDVLLTVDGGTSIGKTVLFDLEGNYTVDSHVMILRPEGISPLVIVYLLACPIGQLQFQRAESGASGQTSVTEDDLRRFKFPLKNRKYIENEVSKIDSTKKQMEIKKNELDQKLKIAWNEFSDNLLRNSKK